MRDHILLDLTEHCIQTAAKHAYDRLLSTLLADEGPDESAEAHIRILTAFLEQTDFRALRAKHPALRGGAGIVVRLERSCSGAVEWLIVEGG